MTSKVPIPTLDPNKLKEEESWKPDPKDIDDDGNHEIPTENEKHPSLPISPPD